jgi:hypothetical protein
VNQRGRDILLIGVAALIAALLGFLGARFTVSSDAEIEAAAFGLLPNGWKTIEVVASRPSVEFAWPIESRARRRIGAFIGAALGAIVATSLTRHIWSARFVGVRAEATTRL